MRAENLGGYRARKVWLQLRGEGVGVASCKVKRLMRPMDLQGVRRVRFHGTAIADEHAARPLDPVNRKFMATRPDQLRFADFTCVPTRSDVVYVAFVIDGFARTIVGWRVTTSMKTDLVLDALAQALWARRAPAGLIHLSDRCSRCLSIRYSERPGAVVAASSVGRVGDSSDSALAATIIGLLKAEVIARLGPWRGCDAVEPATLHRVEWFNNRRMLASIGNVPPAEREAACHRDAASQAQAA